MKKLIALGGLVAIGAFVFACAGGTGTIDPGSGAGTSSGSSGSNPQPEQEIVIPPALRITATFVAATLGNVLGAVVNFVLGRFLIRFEGRRWFPVSAASRQKAEALFARYGRPVLLLSWLPVIGDPLTLVAGLLRCALLIVTAAASYHPRSPFVKN